MAAQQPDYAALGGDLQGVANEVSNAASITLLQLHGLVDQFEQRIAEDDGPVSCVILDETLVLIFLCTVLITFQFRSIIRNYPAPLLWYTLQGCTETSC